MSGQLLFGFKNLVNANPNTSIFDYGSILFDDTYLKSINPGRYRYYIKFVNGLADPLVLEKFIYKTKEAKDYKENLNEKIIKLTTLIKRAQTNMISNEYDKLKDNVKNVIEEKYNPDIATIFTENLLKKGGTGAETNAEDFIMTNNLNKGNQPIKLFLNQVNKQAPQLLAQPINLNSPSDLIKTSDIKGFKYDEDTKKAIRNLYENYKDNLSPKQLEIKFIDRFIFMITTFIIRYITLMIINWGLNTNMINSFHSAFFSYCIIYLLFFIFVITIVNVVVYYPVLELFSSSNIINIPNLLYYFYIYTNGSMRLLIHIFVIILIMILPYIINMEKIRLDNLKANKNNISHNYDKKQKIYDTISFFSLIVWILTSIIAIKF